MQITKPVSYTAESDDENPDEDESNIDFAATHPAQFYILDGALVEDGKDDFWNPLAELLPHDIRVGGPRHAAAFVDEIAHAIKNRGDADNAPPIFLIIDNLGRFRDLRKSDDDYSFSADKNKKSTPARHFVDILKNGPAVGVHDLVRHKQQRGTMDEQSDSARTRNASRVPDERHRFQQPDRLTGRWQARAKPSDLVFGRTRLA